MLCPTLQGRHVLLRPLSPDDAPALALAAAESRETYAYNPIPDGLPDAQCYIARALQQRDAGQRLPFTIIYKNRIVGSTSYLDFQPWHWPDNCPLQRADRPDAAEIGYTWLAASAQRTACNTECKFLLLTHAFETWNAHRVSFRTDQRNTRSRRAIERLGAQLDGILRADRPGQDCTLRHSALYSILQPEWPAIKSRLIQLLNPPESPV